VTGSTATNRVVRLRAAATHPLGANSATGQMRAPAAARLGETTLAPMPPIGEPTKKGGTPFRDTYE